MKPIKQLLEEWTEHNASLYENETKWDDDYSGYVAGSAASNELVLRLWEALEMLIMSDKNKERLIEVDSETLRMMSLHTSFICEKATDDLNTYLESLK